MQIIFALALSYLAGSIPFGYLIPRVWNIDIRRHGSGNIGATNVFRTLGPLAGGLAFGLDLAKGALPVLLMQRMTGNPWLIILAAIAAVLGHTFSIFMGFKGGRGAATGLGVLLSVAPDIFLGALLLVVLIILVTRYVSVASILTPILVTAAFFLLKRPLPYALASGVVSLLIILRHVPNIKRLIQRTEPRIGEKNE